LLTEEADGTVPVTFYIAPDADMPGTPVLFALSSREFSMLALRNGEMLRWILEAEFQIRWYRGEIEKEDE
jgi:hypothetical protein